MLHRVKPAYSLFELLCVVAIIAILSGIALANWGLARKNADKAVEFHKRNAAKNNGALRGNFEDNQRPSDQNF